MQDPNKLVFLDESSATLSMSRLYARAICGERAIGFAPYQKNGRVSIIGAIGVDGIRGSMTVNGTVDGEVFRTFLEQILAANMKENDILILDNLSVHKVARIQEFVLQAKFKMMFLPPYSPDFNPIEMLWSKVKGTLRGFEARTYRTLNQAMTSAMKAVTSSDIQGWFNHCGFIYQPV